MKLVLVVCLALGVAVAGSIVVGQDAAGKSAPARNSQPAASDVDASTSASHHCHENFDCPPFDATLLGKAGGEGFDGPWCPAGFNAQDHEAYRIVAGSLRSPETQPEQGYMRTEASPLKEIQYPPNLFFDFGNGPSSEGSSRTVTYQPIKGVGRRLAQPIEASQTITVYVAALIRPERATVGDSFGGYIGFYLDGTGNSDLFVGVGGASQPKYCLENRGGDQQVASEHIAEIGRTDLLVVKAEMRPGMDLFTLYVNPDIRAPEPQEGTVKRDLDLGTVSQIVLYSTGAYSLDEFRIVGSFSELAE